MNKLILPLIVVGLMACNTTEPTEVKVMGRADCCSRDTTNVVDSLQNVGELLDYLETIPSTHR